LRFGRSLVTQGGVRMGGGWGLSLVAGLWSLVGCRWSLADDFERLDARRRFSFGACFASLGRPRRPSPHGGLACSFRDGAKVFAYGARGCGAGAEELFQGDAKPCRCSVCAESQNRSERGQPFAYLRRVGRVKSWKGFWGTSRKQASKE
jgi:hypothetical protein